MIRRALAALRSLAGNGRPDDLDALIVVTRECEPLREVRDLLVRAKAALRTCDYGDEDFAEWARELMFEEES